MYLGSGLGPSEWEPWSGNYSVYMTVWTNAHVGQFTEPGWTILGVEGEIPGILGVEGQIPGILGGMKRWSGRLALGYWEGVLGCIGVVLGGFLDGS